MAQVTKFTIDANLSGIQLRTQASEMLTALSTLNSGYLEPVNPTGGMLWLDTTKNILKIRNKTNTAWLDFASISDRAVIGSASALTGMIIASASVNIPEGFLLCDGSAISISAYINLYNVIGNAYGNGNGSTTFNIPDLRGEFIRGADNGRGVDGGRALGSTQSDAIRNITGQFAGYGDRFLINEFSGVFGRTGSASRKISVVGEDYNETSYNGANFDASRVVPTANENRPRNVAVNFYIKY
nr:MAG TPA: tail fiber protein [Caudoviricetes sp.]